MSASLVGSEMCIRDSTYMHAHAQARACALTHAPAHARTQMLAYLHTRICEGRACMLRGSVRSGD
eukprot:4101672-Alexandrium_andersonii.AAC.1